MDLILRFLILNQVFSIQVADDDNLYNQQLELEQKNDRRLRIINTSRGPALSPEAHSISVLQTTLATV